jgi:hypothetical protein
MLPFTTPFYFFEGYDNAEHKNYKKGNEVYYVNVQQRIERDTSKEDAKYRLHSKLPENQFQSGV